MSAASTGSSDSGDSLEDSSSSGGSAGGKSPLYSPSAGSSSARSGAYTPATWPSSIKSDWMKCWGKKVKVIREAKRKSNRKKKAIGAYHRRFLLASEAVKPEAEGVRQRTRCDSLYPGTEVFFLH